MKFPVDFGRNIQVTQRKITLPLIQDFEYNSPPEEKVNLSPFHSFVTKFQNDGKVKTLVFPIHC